MMEAKLALMENMKVVSFELAFQCLNNQPIWSSVDRKITKIPLTGQSSVSPFDHENAVLYFNFLTMKTIELDFDVSY